LRADIETSPISLDPRFATDAISSRIDELIFDSLVRLDEHQLYSGDLAESIEWQSGTLIVFHLRRGLKFSDGTPLTAQDVKFTYDSLMDPATRSPKTAGFAQLASVEAPDDDTVVFRLKQTYAPALEMAMLGIVPGGSRLAPLAPSRIVGSGPFKLINFAREEQLLLARNPYRSCPIGSAQEIDFKIVPDPTVRALELAKGTADLAQNNLEPDVLKYLQARRDLRIASTPGSAYQYLAFNFRDARLRDLRVRQAVAFAIDRKAIINSILRGTAREATGMLSPESWAYDPTVSLRPYNPSLARRLLDLSGYPSRGGNPRFALVYNTTPEGRRLGEILQAMLAVVGIRLEIKTSEFATFYSDIQRGNFDLASFRWIGINDPNHYFLIFDSKMTPPEGLNRGAYSNPAMDRLVEAGQLTIDREKRRRIYQAVQQLAAADLPYVSLWWLDNVTVMNDRIRGFEPYPNGSLRSFASLELLAEPAQSN
jgi:peptide/nickel transport system substrate-binding protein